MSSLLGSLITIVTHTPLWVWPLYAMLLFLGFQRTRDSSLALWRVLVLPIVVAVLAIVSFVSFGLNALPVMLFGLAVGGAAGWRLEREGITSRRLTDGRLWLRGEWWTFFQIVVVLVFRYSTSIVAAMYPALSADLTWHLATGFVSAALSALFLGRTAARLRVFHLAAPKTA